MLRRIVKRFRRLRRWQQGALVVAGMAGILGGGIAALMLYSETQSNSNGYIRRWFNDPRARADLMNWRDDVCHAAPFQLPSDGMIGLLWSDTSGPYNVLRRHTGLDIFGDGAPGEVPVYAAYDGYLTRQADWLSSVIIRHDDPLHPGRTIWTYYTHMAARDGDESYVVPEFPPGTSEVWVEQGTLLGYQGEYSGSVIPVGLHVHFSIVTSEPDGSYKNEASLDNTLDPSPYLGMTLHNNARPPRPIPCS